MAQPKEVQAFRIVAPQPPDGAVIQRFDKQLMAKGSVRLRPLSVGHGLMFGYMESAQHIDFGIFTRAPKCVGYVSFSKLHEPVLVDILHDIVKPHAQLLPEYRGKGVTRNFYLSMLHHGYSLATESHTASAAKLWESLAKELSITVLHWDKHLCVWVTKPSARTLKVLTLKAEL